ncbi:hypothetical protein CA51_22380 [Rosistilla oblonga]|uniref:hypothetical protein n=1 Tax=Rosistilla oblonga TaxID=2527990 RepID=UPI001187A1DE|nr:hypothetical protein [Rosistilla oblonga]QDV12355.1 hypothetical protein CA51_22380 [Rosistilla oblonga]
MEEMQPDELPLRQDVRFCLSAFRDAHVILPRRAGRAQLWRQALKLQWREAGDNQVFDTAVRRLGETSFWELVVEEGYGIASGYRVIFTQPEPGGGIWILSVMMLDEPLTDFLIEILQMRLNVILERMHISHDNPFGLP